MNRAQRRNLLKVKNKPKHNRASVAASKAEEGITASNAQGIIDNPANSADRSGSQ